MDLELYILNIALSEIYLIFFGKIGRAARPLNNLPRDSDKLLKGGFV